MTRSGTNHRRVIINNILILTFGYYFVLNKTFVAMWDVSVQSHLSYLVFSLCFTSRTSWYMLKCSGSLGMIMTQPSMIGFELYSLELSHYRHLLVIFDLYLNRWNWYCWHSCYFRYSGFGLFQKQRVYRFNIQ